MMAALHSVTLGEFFGTFVVIVGAVASFIQISPLKLNPWTWLAKHISRLFNGAVLDEVEDLKEEIADLKSDLAAMKEDNDRRDAETSRRLILRFADEIMHGQLHSKEHYNEVLHCCNKYDQYCLDHPEFRNHLTVRSEELIIDKFDLHTRNNDFLE